METFQMTAQDLIRIEFRIFFVCAVRKRSDIASFGKAKEVGGWQDKKKDSVIIDIFLKQAQVSYTLSFLLFCYQEY